MNTMTIGGYQAVIAFDPDIQHSSPLIGNYRVFLPTKNCDQIYDLWALGTVAPMAETDLRQLAGAHFP